MNKFLLISTLLFAVAFAVEVVVIDQENAIPNEYIVLFHENTTDIEAQVHMISFRKHIGKNLVNNRIIDTYSIGSFKGFAAVMSADVLALEQVSPLVAHIEQNSVVYSSACGSQSNAVWGLDRIAEKTMYLDGVYRHETESGNGVDAYVVDTGINIAHTNFGGRAIWGANFVDSNNKDCNGHGTHVAGTIGATTYGVTKKSTLIAVKVLNCEGSGTNAGVISGIQWVATSYASRKKPSVANMSLGGSKSTAINNAVNSVVSAGVTFVVAAGNENDNACNYSPASATSAISVGSTTIGSDGRNQIDARSEFSNYGSCVDVFAPGSEITSTWIGSKNTEILTISGTSMASPHVAGVVAAYLHKNPNSSPSQVQSWINGQATQGVIDLECSYAYSPSSCNQSPNSFVYLAC